jgi:hypothetical protein
MPGADQRDPGGDHPLGLESQWSRDESAEALNEQSRSHHQQHRDRDLEADEDATRDGATAAHDAVTTAGQPAAE